MQDNTFIIFNADIAEHEVLLKK